MIYECENCGFQYPEEFVRDWGKHEQSSGKGPRPVCVQLVEDERAPKARDSQGDFVDEPVLQVCNGMLERVVGQDQPNNEQMRFALTPIRGGRRS